MVILVYYILGLMGWFEIESQLQVYLCCLLLHNITFSQVSGDLFWVLCMLFVHALATCLRSCKCVRFVIVQCT